MSISCPYCHAPIGVETGDPLSDVTCPECGSSFSLVSGEETLTFEGGAVRRIAQFELIERLGAGQFGDVWKARDTKLDRFVAVKIPRKDQLSEQEAEWFLREARAAAQLAHANIVSVHEAGERDGTLYIVSDFVAGASLREWIEDRRLTHREAAQMVVRIAEALHYAHERGVVHRDLKPANVMIDLDGQPLVMDFGLAKRETGEVTMTIAGKVLGTPAYMPPEQARGEGHAVDRRADVYSLGVILFELLTGERPFRGGNRMLLMQILADPAPSPRKFDLAVSRDLETICLKCLEKEPDLRYATARELADDLRRWLEGRPIAARPVGPVGKLWRWCRRKPGVATLTLTSLLLAAVILTGGPILYVKEAIARQQADERGEDVARADERRRRVEADLRAEQAQRALLSASSFMQRGQWRKALESLKIAEDAGVSDRVEIRLLRIRALRSVFELREWSAEIARLESAGNLGTHRARFLVVKAEQLRYQGKHDESLALIKQALELGLPEVEEEYARGLIAKTTPQAASHFRKAVDADPFFHEAASTLVATLVLSGELDEAKTRARFAGKLFPTDPNYPTWLALIAALEQDRPRMQKWLDRLGTQLSNKNTAFMRQILQSVFSAVKSIVELDSVGSQTANLQLLSAWSKLTQLQDRIRSGSSDDPKFASLASSMRASLPPALTTAFTGFGELNLLRMPGILAGQDERFNKALTNLTRVHPEGTLFWLRAAMFVRRNKYPEAADELVRAAEAPAMIPAIKPQSMFLAAVAVYVHWQNSGNKPQDIRRAADLAMRRIRMGGIRREFAEVLLRIGYDARDKKLSLMIVDDVRRRFPSDVEWMVRDMNTQFAGGTYFRAIQLANLVLAQDPKHPQALAVRNAAAAKVEAIVRGRKKPPAPAVKAKKPSGE